MRPNTLLTLFILCYISTSATCIYGIQVIYDVASKNSNSVLRRDFCLADCCKEGCRGRISLRNHLLNIKIGHPSKDLADVDSVQDTKRDKRDIESLENDDYPSAATQDEKEEPGFWDRIVRVALKLFNRFIEWLNSS